MSELSEIALTSSVLIAVIIIVRHFLRGKIAPRLQYAVWLLVAARLLIPGSLFTVPVSITGTVSELSAAFASTGTKDMPVHRDTGGYTAAPAPDSPDASGPAAESFDAHSPAGQAGMKRHAVDWPGLLWKSGAVITGSVMLFSNLCFYDNLRRKRRVLTLPGAETGNLPVYLVEDLPSPCLFGLLCPAIYLNSQALTAEHLNYVLTHERTHFRHGDHLWSILRGVCLAVHWYNPLVWLAASMSRQDCELACDDGVIWVLGEGQRLDYGTALLHMIAPGRPSLLRASTSMTSGKRNMKERITLIIQRPKMMKVTMALVILLLCGTVAMTFGAPASAAVDDPSQADIQQDILSASPRPITRLDSADYTHFSGLFSLTVPKDWMDNILFEENEDGVSFYDASVYSETPENSLLLTIYPQASAWAAAYDQNTLSLGDFNTNGSAYVYLLDWRQSSSYGGRVQALRDAVAESFQLNASADAFSRLVYGTYETNMPLAVSYLPYLSWENYGSVLGEEEMDSLLASLTDFIRSGSSDWNQYHDIMSNRTDSAIDSTFSGAYQDLVWELYHQNPSRFSSVLKSEFLTSGERDHMLAWFRSALAAHQDWPEALEFNDEALYHLLGISDLKSIG